MWDLCKGQAEECRKFKQEVCTEANSLEQLCYREQRFLPDNPLDCLFTLRLDEDGCSCPALGARWTMHPKNSSSRLIVWGWKNRDRKGLIIWAVGPLFPLLMGALFACTCFSWISSRDEGDMWIPTIQLLLSHKH